jgi:hypothetical protein
VCYLGFNFCNVSNIGLCVSMCDSCVSCFYLICIYGMFLLYLVVSIFSLFLRHPLCRKHLNTLDTHGLSTRTLSLDQFSADSTVPTVLLYNL